MYEVYMSGVTLYEGWIDASSGRALLWVSLGDIPLESITVDQIHREDGTPFTVSDISAVPITGVFRGPDATRYLWVELGDISGEVDVSGSVQFSSDEPARLPIISFHSMPAALVIHACGYQTPADSPVRIFPAVSPQDLSGYSFYSNRLLGSGPIVSSGVDDIIVFEDSEVPESIVGIGFDANGTPTGISDSVLLTAGVQSIYTPITILSDVTWDASGYHFDISCNVADTKLLVYPYLEAREQSGSAISQIFDEAGLFNITIPSDKWTPFVRIEASSTINPVLMSDPIVESVLGYRPFTAGESIDVRSVIGDPDADAITVRVGMPEYPVYAYEIYVAEGGTLIGSINHTLLEANEAFDEYALVAQGYHIQHPSVVTIRARDASDGFIDVSANVAWLPPVPNSVRAWVDYDGATLTMGWPGALDYVSDISTVSILNSEGVTLLTITDFGMEGTTFLARFSGTIKEEVKAALQDAVYRADGDGVQISPLLTVVTSNTVGSSSSEFSISISTEPLRSVTSHPTTGLLTVQILQSATEPPVRRIRVGDNAFAYPDVSSGTTVSIDISYNSADFLSMVEFGNDVVTRTLSVVTGAPPTPNVELVSVIRAVTEFEYKARVTIPDLPSQLLFPHDFTWSVYDVSSGGTLIHSTVSNVEELSWTSAPARLSEVWIELSNDNGVAPRSQIIIHPAENPAPWGLEVANDRITWNPMDTEIIDAPYRLIDVSTGELLFTTTDLSVSVNELPFNQQITLAVEQGIHRSETIEYYIDAWRNREFAPGWFNVSQENSPTGPVLMFTWQHYRVNSELPVRYRFSSGTSTWIDKYDIVLGGGFTIPAHLLPAQFYMTAYRIDSNGDDVPYSESVPSNVFYNTHSAVVIGTELAPTALALSEDRTLTWSEATAQTFYPKKYNVYADGNLLITVTSPSLPPWNLYPGSAVYTVKETNGEDESPASASLLVDSTNYKNRVDPPTNIRVLDSPRRLVWAIDPNPANPNTATSATVYYKKPDGTFAILISGIPVMGHILCSELLPETHTYAVAFSSNRQNSESNKSAEIGITVSLTEIIDGPSTANITETSVRTTIEAVNAILAADPSKLTEVREVIRATVQKLTNPVSRVDAFPAASFLTRVVGIADTIRIATVDTTILAPTQDGLLSLTTTSIGVGDLVYIMADSGTSFHILVDNDSTPYTIALQAGGAVLVNNVEYAPGASFMIGTMPVVYSGIGSAGFTRTGGGGVLAPIITSAISPASGSIEVHWSYTGQAVSFNVYWDKAGTTNSYNVSDSTLRSYMITGLADGSYDLQIGAVDGQGNEERSIVFGPVSVGSGGGGGGGAICFLGNAPVLTPSGYRRIDSLREGDLVQTADGRSVAIQRTVHQRVTASAAVNPYIIERGQFSATRRFLISPEHRIAVAGRGLIEARHLGLQQEERTGTLDYYNLELPDWQKDNLVVAGVEVESLAPVRRVVITHAAFRQMVAQQYGAMTPAIQAKILKTCKFLPGGRVEVPAMRR